MSFGRFIVGIDGASSTGKTTLVNELGRVFQGRLSVADEAVRTVAPEFGVDRASDWPGLLLDERRTDVFFPALESRACAQEDALAPCLVDSTLFQIAIYRELFTGVLDTSLARSRGYAAILYCGLIEGSHDGFRFLDRREEFDARYRHMIARDYEGLFVPLPPGEERIALAETVVAELMGRFS